MKTRLITLFRIRIAVLAATCAVMAQEVVGEKYLVSKQELIDRGDKYMNRLLGYSDEDLDGWEVIDWGYLSVNRIEITFESIGHIDGRIQTTNIPYYVIETYSHGEDYIYGSVESVGFETYRHAHSSETEYPKNIPMSKFPHKDGYRYKSISFFGYPNLKRVFINPTNTVLPSWSKDKTHGIFGLEEVSIISSVVEKPRGWGRVREMQFPSLWQISISGIGSFSEISSNSRLSSVSEINLQGIKNDSVYLPHGLISLYKISFEDCDIDNVYLAWDTFKRGIIRHETQKYIETLHEEIQAEIPDITKLSRPLIVRNSNIGMIHASKNLINIMGELGSSQNYTEIVPKNPEITISLGVDRYGKLHGEYRRGVWWKYGDLYKSKDLINWDLIGIHGESPKSVGYDGHGFYEIRQTIPSIKSIE